MEKIRIEIHNVKDAEKLYMDAQTAYNNFQNRMRIKYNDILWNMTKEEKQENDKIARNYNKAITTLYNARNCDSIANQKPALCEMEIIDKRN